MPENPPEKTYKHQVPADIFVEAFTTVKWTDEQTIKFNKFGIERLKGWQMKRFYSTLNKWYYDDEADYTLIQETRIVGDLFIRDVNSAIIPNLVLYNTTLENILIENCLLAQFDETENRVLSGTNFFIESSIIGNFEIKNKSRVNNFKIFESACGDVRVYDKSYIGDFNIWNHSSIKEFSLGYNCNAGKLYIYQANFERIQISNSECIEILTYNSKIDYFFIFNESKLNEIVLEDCKLIFFYIEGCTVDFLYLKWTTTSVLFRKSYQHRIQFMSCNLQFLEINIETINELNISGGKILLLHFAKYTLRKESLIFISDIKIYACIMNEFTVLGIFKLTAIDKVNESFNMENLINNLVGDNYRNNLLGLKHEMEQIKLSGPTFRINFTSLNKVEFIECKLEEFNFEYNNSKLIDIFITGGTLPKFIKVYESENRFEYNSVERLEQKKSFFDQLKKVFENQGDIVKATKYHARTSEIQMQIIEHEKGKWNTEWLVYWLNKVSNRHGESWGQAILFILCVSVPLYIAYWFCTLQFSINGDWSWQLLWNSIGHYFSFLLPTHKIDFIPGADTNFGTMVFDFFGRIIIGYGIYQLISAFRKHGKKG